MLTEDDRERIKIGHAMERLLALPEWPVFAEWMETRIAQAYYKTVMTPVATLDGALPVEYAKGTLKGIELTLIQPSLIVQEMRAILEREAQEGDDNGPGNLGKRHVGYESDEPIDGIDGGHFAP